MKTNAIVSSYRPLVTKEYEEVSMKFVLMESFSFTALTEIDSSSPALQDRSYGNYR